MAINTWLNATADKNAANKVDRADHGHTVRRGAADALDFTIAFDSAVVTKLTTFDSLVEQVRKLAISAGLT